MESQEMTQEEVQQLRQDVAQEIAAEEAGESPSRREETAEPNVDPWAGVNPALKTLFDDMQTRVSVLDETQARLRQAETRIGAMSNEFYNAKKAAENVSAAPTKEQMAEAAKSDDDWNQLRSEFPEWADATDNRMNAKIAAVEAKLRKELSNAGAGPAIMQQEIARLRDEYQRDLVSMKHPDWEQVIASPEYNAWLKEQPADLQAKIKSDKAKDAVAVLDAFANKGATKTAAEIIEERSRRLRTGVNPQGRKSVPLKSESDMNEAELRSTIGAEVFAR